jgi:lysophospholipase L1-like esterase
MTDQPINQLTNQPATYLALGDSYTIGEAVEAPERFPVQAASLLRAEGINISDPDIIAVTGWTTGNLLNAIKENPPKENYSIVSLLIGVNNQYQGKPLDEYKAEFTTLVEAAIKYAGNNKDHVFVVSIPDWGVTPFAKERDTNKIAEEIDIYNQINKTISQDKGVNYLDITSISREGKADSSLQASDGLHPSGKQYALWARLLAPMMQKAFTK